MVNCDAAGRSTQAARKRESMNKGRRTTMQDGRVPVPETMTEQQLLERFNSMNRHQRRALVAMTNKAVRKQTTAARRRAAKAQKGETS